MIRSSLLKPAVLLLTLTTLLPVHAQPPGKGKGDDKKEEKDKKDDGDKDKKKEDAPPLVETPHEITVRGQKIAYKSTAGSLTLTKAYGEPRADVFHIAYLRSDLDADAVSKRPVCFCFNGGPGSSSVWLHLGAFGPRRVVLPPDGVTAPAPPYSLTDNQFTLLPDCDLVFIDPVSTGLSRPEKGEDAHQFHGYREDIESLGDFVRLWLTKNKRWSSPKFLMGESYGGIRGAGLADHLQSRYGMYLNGLIVVSGLFDYKTLMPDEQNDVPYLGWLPSMAATAHWHKKLSPELQADFVGTVKRATEFARGPYASGLLLGSSIPEDQKKKIAAELSALTSLPVDLILRENLRINPGLFRQRLLESENKVIGRYDGRVSGQGGDPSYDVVLGAFAGSMNRYLSDPVGLNFQTDRPYEILGGPGMTPWNFSATNEYLEVATPLTKALTGNPSLRVFLACGYQDLATPAENMDYSVRHMDLPPALRGNIQWGHYDGGHMMYTNLPSLEKLSADVTAFIKKP
jgi:carboxypeptidase C (cathepsin A)